MWRRSDRNAARWGVLVRFERRLLARSAGPWLIAALFVSTTVVAAVSGRDHVRRHDVAVRAASEEAERAYAGVRRDAERIERERTALAVRAARVMPELLSAQAVEGRLHDFRAGIPALPTMVVSLGSGALPQRYVVRGGDRFAPFTRTVDGKILGGVFPERPTDNPAALQAGRVDLAFAAVFVYPLLVIALVCDVVSGDRDVGTLAFVSAQPVSFRRWLAVRLSVRAQLVLLCGVIVPTAAVVLATPMPWSFDASVRLLTWATALCAYVAFWFAVTAAISVRAKSTALSLVMSVGAWLLLVAIVPAIVSRGLSLLTSSSGATAVAYASAERQASLTINARVDAAVTALNHAVRERFPAPGDPLVLSTPIALAVEADLLDVLPQSEWPSTMTAPQLSRALAAARRTLFEAALRDIVADLDRNERRARTVFAVARFSSPALLLQEITDDVAGTGWRRWSSFVDQLDTHMRRREAFFTTKVLAVEHVGAGELVNAAPFRPREEDSLGVVRRALLPVAAILCVPAALAVALAARRVAWPPR